MKKICGLIIICMLLFISGCTRNNKNMMANTTWHMDDESEVIFTDDTIYWYKESSDHSRNYYAGKYKFYIGKQAVDYIVNDLSEYGVTRSELQDVFDSNDNYSINNFVVFDIRYNEYDLDGVKQSFDRPLNPWMGFILNNNTYLDVANMNTYTYYALTKQK